MSESGVKGSHSYGELWLLGGWVLRTPLVDYVIVTVNRGDTPTQQAAGAYVTGHIPTSGFLLVSGPQTPLLRGGSESHR